MRLRPILLLPILWLTVALAFACGDDDNTSPSRSPGDATMATGEDIGPADAVAIFAPADETHDAIEALLGSDNIRLVLAAESSREAASFDELTIPGALEIIGTSAASTARPGQAFEQAYEDETGSPPDDTARQTYDAVYLAALAAAAANNNDPAAIASHVPFVANPPGELIGPGVEDFAHALTLLADGQDINYVGASGLVDLDANGDLSKGATEVWKLINGEIAPLETRDVDLAAEIEADIPAGTLAPAADAPTDPLIIETSADQDAFLLALAEINDAGGVFGQPVEQPEDDAGAHVVIASAADTAPAADAVVISLSTSADPTTADDHLFRLAPPQTIQTPVLANLAGERDVSIVCVVHSDDPAGQAMAGAFKVAFEHKGGAVRRTAALGEGDTAEILDDCIGS